MYFVSYYIGDRLVERKFMRLSEAYRRAVVVSRKLGKFVMIYKLGCSGHCYVQDDMIIRKFGGLTSRWLGQR
jgi:hypothetical protein